MEYAANKCSGWPRQKFKRKNRRSLLYLRSYLFSPFSAFKCLFYAKCHGSAHLKIKDYQRSRFESFHSWKEIKIITKSIIFLLFWYKPLRKCQKEEEYSVFNRLFCLFIFWWRIYEQMCVWRVRHQQPHSDLMHSVPTPSVLDPN